MLPAVLRLHLNLVSLPYLSSLFKFAVILLFDTCFTSFHVFKLSGPSNFAENANRAGNHNPIILYYISFSRVTCSLHKFSLNVHCNSFGRIAKNRVRLSEDTKLTWSLTRFVIWLNVSIHCKFVLRRQWVNLVFINDPIIFFDISLCKS